MQVIPQKLFIYECRGNCPPKGEPKEDGFLGLWPEVPFYYLFFDREAAGCVSRWLQDQQDWVLTDSYQLDYDQWQQASGGVQKVGPFVIEKEGIAERDASVGEGIRIRLNPGLVFGSGMHETTRGCLLAVAYAFEKLPVRSVVDLGTGAGILAVASALLGASQVAALDCNSLAVSVARKNVAQNGLEHSVHLIVASQLSVLKPASDLLLMNIEWPCLLDVIRQGDWTSYRTVVMSGFLEAQWRRLQDRLPPDYSILSTWVLDDWMTVLISK